MSATQSRIAELAALIAENTAKVDDFLREKGLATPSFDVDAPAHVPIPPEATEIETARRIAMEAATELTDLLSGSTALLRPQLNGTSLHAIYTYDIPAKVPVHGSVSYRDLASQCGVPEADLKRLLRFAMTWHHVFREPKVGFVAHTAASRELAENPKQFDMIGLTAEESWPGMSRTIEAMQKWADDEPNHTGHALAVGTDDNMFNWLGKNPEKGRRFASAISTLVPVGQPAAFLIESFDWAFLGTSKVVDVGGSWGGVSVLLAKEFPDLHFIVQDLPEVINGAKDKIPETLRDRIELMAHDFFQQQTVVADVYLLRAIFHNWPDTYCLKILRQFIPALRKGARIVINDAISPEPGTLGLLAERNLRAFDLLMKTLFNAREREKADWMELFHRADSRFHVIDVKTPSVGTMGVIVAEWNGSDKS